jgi:hypothetical protein
MSVGRVVHCKREAFDVYIGRPSRWGNTFTHKKGTAAEIVVGSREEAVAAYREQLWKDIKSGEMPLDELASLAGKTLGCWCSPQLCHGEVLAAAAAWAAEQIKN